MGYDGRPFAGYARQPDQLTVEGALLEALAEAADLEFRDQSEAATKLEYRSGSRTDRGVSAACNVFSVIWPTTFGEFEPSKVIVWRKHAGQLLLRKGHPVFLGPWAQVPDDFRPRHATERTYRYLLPADGLALEPIQKTARLLEGEHDFATFCRSEGKSTVLTLSSCQVRSNQPPFTLESSSDLTGVEQGMESVPARYLTLTFTAPYFRWQLVRRLVAALEAVGKGKATPKQVVQALETPDASRSWGAAPPENLTLERVVYPEIEWQR